MNEIYITITDVDRNLKIKKGLVFMDFYGVSWRVMYQRAFGLWNCRDFKNTKTHTFAAVYIAACYRLSINNTLLSFSNQGEIEK